ncbi:MAG: agmatinase [Vicinamibacterales bacterium]
MITLLGLPWDGSSSFERGAADAPPHIRAALRSPSSNSFNERGDDVLAADVMADGGDLTVTDDAGETREQIERAVREILASSSKPLLLGGDHSVTYPILRAFRDRGPLTVLHFDAHGDIYDHFEGDRYSHACPFARVMEERLATRLVQVGLRTLTPHQRSQSKNFATEVFGADRWRDAIPVVTAVRGSVYVSLDIDVLEPMIAPGLSHPEPGGLSVRDVLEVISALRTAVVGADVVEYNPRYDLRDLTARVAAKFVKELVGAMH